MQAAVYFVHYINLFFFADEDFQKLEEAVGSVALAFHAEFNSLSAKVVDKFYRIKMKVLVFFHCYDKNVPPASDYGCIEICCLTLGICGQSHLDWQLRKLNDGAYQSHLKIELLLGTQIKCFKNLFPAYGLKRTKTVINEWSTHSTYGYNKMSKHLKRLDYDWAGEKIIRNLYKELGIKGQKPVFKTTRNGKAPYGKFPYLLRNKFIAFPN